MTLRQLRESKGIGPVAVAKRLGVTYAAIWKIETTGETHLTTLEAYAAALNIPFSEVYAASVQTRQACGKRIAGLTDS